MSQLTATSSTATSTVDTAAASSLIPTTSDNVVTCVPPPEVVPDGCSDEEHLVVRSHHLPAFLHRYLPASVIHLYDRLHHHISRISSHVVQGTHAQLYQSSTIYANLFTRIRALPITEFYLYMWRVDPTLFINTMFVNYGLPILMEAMPWYLSRRKISRLLRESRNSITHRLVANEAFSDTAIGNFILFSLVFALVQTIEQVLRTRVLLANRLLIKRLVLERILYSELGSLQERYYAVFGEEVRTEQLEMHVFNDISETLNLFNTTIPSLLRGAYTLVGSSHDLWLNRGAFDYLAILRPSLVGLTSEAVNYVREKYIVDAQTLQQQKNASAMSRVVTNIVDGLAEIQTNNMQRFQLLKLDVVSGEELQNQQGTSTFINNIYRQVSNRSVFDFASEVYVVRMVMSRRNINHETYRQVQNDIDYVTRLFGRLYAQARDAHRVYETQERVIALLNLPSFIQEARARSGQSNELAFLLDQDHKSAHQTEEETRLKETTASTSSTTIAAMPSPMTTASAALSSSTTFDFQTLLFRRCVFRYKPNLPLALNIHPRAPGEVAPTTEGDDVKSCDEDEKATLPTQPNSTQPRDLCAEMETVLSHPRLPTSMLRTVSLLVPPIPPEPPLDNHNKVKVLSNPNSVIMSEMLQSRVVNEDQDGDVVDANCPTTAEMVENCVVFTKDKMIKELDEFVTQKEEAGLPLEFQPSLASTTSSATSSQLPSPTPVLPTSSMTIDARPTTSSPPPRTSPFSSTSPSSSICEPGTLLFERGKSYALIGENRSGKSTLMQILCKLYQPPSEDCDILLNNTDFTKLPRVFLRDHVSYVAQRPFIFPGTIEENIRIGNTQATQEEVEQAAEWAGIFAMEPPKSAANGGGVNGSPTSRSLVDRTGMTIVAKPWEQNRLKSVLLTAGSWLRKQWLKIHGFDEEMIQAAEEEMKEEKEEGKVEDDLEKELPQQERESNQQLSTSASSSLTSSSSSAIPSRRPIHPTLLFETAERGANLSGGFAQSVALARVFLRKQAQIIILDEAMGQMDAIKKRELIFPRLFEFIHRHHMTLILISHDVPLVCKLVDTVYVMHHGECVQSGSHQQLMAEKGGAYSRLVGGGEEEDEMAKDVDAPTARSTEVAAAYPPPPQDLTQQGVEPNPGPAGSPMTMVMSVTPATLFRDGLHLIYSYLSLIDWLSSMHTCHHWYVSGCSQPTRHLVYAPHLIDNESASPLPSTASFSTDPTATRVPHSYYHLGLGSPINLLTTLSYWFAFYICETRLLLVDYK